MLNRLYKANEFCRIKPRMHNDKLIYITNDNLKFANTLSRLVKGEQVVSENHVL